MNSLVQITLLAICMGSVFLSSFTVPSSFLLNNNVKFVYGQDNEGLVCNDGLPPYVNSTCPDGISPQPILANETSEGLPCDRRWPTTTSENLSVGGNAISFPEEIQMDTNGDGVVDELESQNQSVTPPPEEIQMDTNGDGVVDAADNPIPSDTTNDKRYTTS